jgi:hypothetical protein
VDDAELETMDTKREFLLPFGIELVLVQMEAVNGLESSDYTT